MLPVSISVRHDIAACRVALCGGSRSFYLASWLLPAEVRDPATALYAFCRLADDAIDVEGADPAALYDRLGRVYHGCPLAIPADRAFADTVARFRIPQALPEALLDGFCWDAEGRRYETLDDLYGYAARVAGSVGAMMGMIMGAPSQAVLARACELGIAMQLSNIARDVGEDARAGRLYLPLQWLRQAGIDPDEWLADPVFTPALGTVVERLLQAADELYQRASTGISSLPISCRPGIRAAQLLYAEIGHEVARRQFDSISQRATVSLARKMWLLTGILVGRRDDRSATAVIEAARFLIEAVPENSLRPARRTPTLGDRVVWVIELFERLERREQLERSRL